MTKNLRLGINVDHVATVRNARGSDYPDPVRAALLAARAGADGITAHLREDRRHIIDEDIGRLIGSIALPLNMEMAASNNCVRRRPDIPMPCAIGGRSPMVRNLSNIT